MTTPPADVPPSDVSKYYAQRHRIFHRYSEGVVLDNVSWFSVTPEKIAAHHAARFAACLPKPPVVLDVFCGAGGNAIQFAHVAHVIAVDNSLQRVHLARHNARVYGVDSYIDFVLGNVNDVLPCFAERGIPIDAVFMSPPWGGPGYLEEPVYDVAEFAPLVQMALKISRNVALLVPRTVSVHNIQKHMGPCELEYNYLGDNLKMCTLYFGDLIMMGESESLALTNETGT